jgi:hypothetical protein
VNQSRGLNQQRGNPVASMLAFQHPFFGLLPKEFVARKKETFTYNIRFNTIAASATNVGTANVDNASDFVWVAASVVVTNAAFTTFTNAANVPMLVEIKDASSGIDFQDCRIRMQRMHSSSTSRSTVSRCTGCPRKRSIVNGGRVQCGVT